MWRKGTLLHCWWECKLIQSLRKTVWRFLKRLGIKPPYDLEIPLLGIYPEETKLKKTHASHFSLQHYLQQLGHGSNLDVHQQMNGQRSCGTYIQWNIKAIQRNAFESVLIRWMNLEPIIQSEVNQKEKDKYCILMHINGIQKNGTEEFIYRAAIEKQMENKIGRAHV